MVYGEQVDFDVERRSVLVPQIAAALREVVPSATHAFITVNDADSDAPYLYAQIIINGAGKRIDSENPNAPENRVTNALVDAETLYSWDGYGLFLDLVRGVETEDDIFGMITG